MDFLEDIFDTISEMKCLDVDVQMNLPVGFQKHLDTLDEDTVKTEKFFVHILGWSKMSTCDPWKLTWKSEQKPTDLYFDPKNGSFTDFVYVDPMLHYCLPVRFRQFMSQNFAEKPEMEGMSRFYVLAWQEVLRTKEKGSKKQRRRFEIPHELPDEPRESDSGNVPLKSEPYQKAEDFVCNEFKEECSKLEVSESDAIEEVKRKYDQFKELAKLEMERIFNKRPKLLNCTIPPKEEMEPV